MQNRAIRVYVIGLVIFTVYADKNPLFTVQIYKVYPSSSVRKRALKIHNSCGKLYYNRKLFETRHTHHKQFSQVVDWGVETKFLRLIVYFILFCNFSLCFCLFWRINGRISELKMSSLCKKKKKSQKKSFPPGRAAGGEPPLGGPTVCVFFPMIHIFQIWRKKWRKIWIFSTVLVMKSSILAVLGSHFKIQDPVEFCWRDSKMPAEPLHF